jgi:hypothetical protein
MPVPTTIATAYQLRRRNTTLAKAQVPQASFPALGSKFRQQSLPASLNARANRYKGSFEKWNKEQ